MADNPQNIYSLQQSSRKKRQIETEKDTPTFSFLCFTLDEAEYGVDLTFVTQIVKPPPLTWVPRVKPHILGIISIRGEGVTLIDTRRLLGLSPTSWPKTARVLMTKLDDEKIGLLVDSVKQVRRIPYESFEENPSLDESHRAESIVGSARPTRKEASQIIILDLRDVLMESLR